ncbi:MAG: NAD-dependent epimerase/dehydratase family protein [Candidatus Velthaea sp.]
MEKIAVTGAAGLIGTALCADLRRDHEVVDIDVRDARTLADVRDLAALERAVAGCAAVVHLAGIVTLGAQWDEVLAVNVAGTYNVFEAARRRGVRRVIFASSNHAVGMHETNGGAGLYRPGAGVVVRTDDAFCPDSWYGVGKAFGEVLGRYFSDAFGLRVACVRIGSIVAGDAPDDPRLGVPAWLPHLTPEDARARYAATWMSQRDFARLVRAILAHDVPFAAVYGVGDNATRFWDLEPGRAIFGFWPLDGVKPTF